LSFSQHERATVAPVAARDRAQREVTARYCDQVAALNEQVSRALFRMVLFYTVVLLYTFAYLNLYANISYRGGLFFFAIAVPLVCARIWYGFAARRAALTLKESRSDLVGSGAEPPPGQLPVSPAEYIAWCEAHGMPAYPYGRPAWDASS
jgi:hypothetical protein